MGVTIHFEGRLKDAAAYDRVLRLARDFASAAEWRVEPIEEAERTLKRVRNDEDWDYTGTTRGVILYPHENADPLRLEFDQDLYVQEFVKTQFAPPEVHIRVVELLRMLAPEFQRLEVEDEGVYWDRSDKRVLKRHMDQCFRVLEEELREHPDYHGPVRLADGRIVDLMAPN